MKTKTVIIKIVIPDDGKVNHVECQSPEKGIFSPKFEIIELETIQAISYNVTDQAGNETVVVELDDILKLMQC